MLLVAWVISTMIPAVPVLDVLGLFQRFALLPLQLFFAISVTTLLRSLPRAGWVFGGFIVVLLASGAAYLGYQSQLPAPPEWLRVRVGYAALLVVLSMGAIALSNRLWTAQKLMGVGAFGGAVEFLSNLIIKYASRAHGASGASYQIHSANFSLARLHCLQRMPKSDAVERCRPVGGGARLEHLGRTNHHAAARYWCNS